MAKKCTGQYLLQWFFRQPGQLLLGESIHIHLSDTRITIISKDLFSSVMGEMLKLENNAADAKRYFENSIKLTNSAKEKKLLQKKLS